jgi:hypothetical protein
MDAILGGRAQILIRDDRLGREGSDRYWRTIVSNDDAVSEVAPLPGVCEDDDWPLEFHGWVGCGE